MDFCVQGFKHKHHDKDLAGIHYSCSLFSARFESFAWATYVFHGPHRECLRDSGIDEKDVHDLALVGGSISP